MILPGRFHMTERLITYQASDLAGAKRREFLQAARAGSARLRDTDGTSLVMVPQAAFDMLSELKSCAGRYLQVEGALDRRRADRRPSDFGELAWLDAFDDDDLRTFRQEFHEALIRAVATDSTEPVDTCVLDWRTTAKALSDKKRRRILTGKPGAEDFEEVSAPD
jgi:hypothetical protein